MARQSPKMKQAIRLWQSLQDEKQDRIQRRRGILGDEAGIVRVPGRPDLVYMRLNADSTRVWKVVNDQVADTNGLPVIAEKHPDTDFWEVIDVDKEGLISAGVGFVGTPYRQTHSETHEWPDQSPGIDAVNVYRRSLVDLRTEPVYENYSLNVYVRPLVYSYQGTIKRYKGTQPYLSLSSYVPQTGIRSVLTYLDIRTNYFWASPGPPTSYYVGNTPTEPDVPWYAKPSALVTLRESQNIITEADIEDIRDVIDDEGVHHHMTASRAPTTSDDALDGYSEGSFWLYGTTLYVCTNPAIGAAVWGSPGGKVSELWESDGGAVAWAVDADGDLDGTQGNDITLQAASGGPQSGTRRNLLDGIGHILDGGPPSNPYPSTRNADDAEFNNSEQSENNTIGTHAGGDFWEWSPGAPTAVNINTTPSMLYIQKNAGDSGTDRYLDADISAIGEDDAAYFEVVIPAMPNTNKTGNIFAIKLIDTTSGWYIRLQLDDDTVNGLQVVATYDTGGGETTDDTIIIGHPVGIAVIGLYRYESGGNALGRWYFGQPGLLSSRHLNVTNNFALQSLGAKANFVPDSFRLEIINTTQLLVYVDSVRRFDD